MENRTTVPNIDVPNHPLGFLESLARSEPIRSFTLVSYDRRLVEYASNAERDRFVVLAPDIVSRGVEIIKEQAKLGLDVVVSSRVETKRATQHIPMIDFSIPADSISAKDLATRFSKIFAAVTEQYLRGFVFFRSGRSYHAYLPRTVTEDRWREFMLKLLTLPPLPGTGGAPVPDFRWIGHCLLRGFSALRLSAVNEHYLHEPVLVSAVK